MLNEFLPGFFRFTVLARDQLAIHNQHLESNIRVVHSTLTLRTVLITSRLCSHYGLLNLDVSILNSGVLALSFNGFVQICTQIG